MIDASTDRASTLIAVVGASDTPRKWGGRIYRTLKEDGFRVVAVNPGRYQVDGDPCYPSVLDLPEAPTLVDIVVPPAETLRVLAQCVEAGHTRVWVQPGAEDEAVRAFIAEHDLDAVVDACILVEARRRP